MSNRTDAEREARRQMAAWTASEEASATRRTMRSAQNQMEMMERWMAEGSANSDDARAQRACAERMMDEAQNMQRAMMQMQQQAARWMVAAAEMEAN